jgi:hypothetical protein
LALVGENERLEEQICDRENGLNCESDKVGKERDCLLVKNKALQSNYDICVEDAMANGGM